MATTITVNNKTIAVRFWGGDRNGTTLQLEFTEAEWNQLNMNQAVVDDAGGNWSSISEWFDEMSVNARVLFMNAFALNKRATTLNRIANRWAKCGEHNLAHQLATESQVIKQTARRL